MESWVVMIFLGGLLSIWVGMVLGFGLVIGFWALVDGVTLPEKWKRGTSKPGG